MIPSMSRLHRTMVIAALFLGTAGFVCPGGEEIVEPPPPPTSVTLYPTSLMLDVGEEGLLEATVSNAVAGNAHVTWSSSAASIATVDQTGRVVGVSPGTATIAATVPATTGTTKAAASVLVRATTGNGVITGTVTGNGLPMSDVTVRLTGTAERARATGDNGVYRFEELLPGPYTVSLSSYPPGVTFPATSVNVTLAAGQQLTVNFPGTYQQ